MLDRKQLYPQLIVPLGSVPRVRGIPPFPAERKAYNPPEESFLPVSGVRPPHLTLSQEKRKPFSFTE